jgi:uncharacterized protein YecE (DUF72 family)
MTRRKPRAYIGTSGFAYDKWQGRFYPDDVYKKRLLVYYGRFFNTVEINSSFYHLPKPKTIREWQKQVPEDFQLCLKVSRYITHLKRLLESADAIRVFMSSAKHLKTRRGPLLLQLPPAMKPEYGRLAEVLAGFKKAARGWKVAVEIRNDSWYGPELEEVLEEYGASLVVHDMPGSKCDEPNGSADFVYMRFHGPKGDYHGKYEPRKLGPHARKIRRWLKEGKDVYVFFNNDADGYAPSDALKLAKMVAGSR